MARWCVCVFPGPPRICSNLKWHLENTVCPAPGLSRMCWVCARFRNGDPEHTLCSKIRKPYFNTPPLLFFFFWINHGLGFWCTSGRPRSVEGALRTVPFTLHLTPQPWQLFSVAGRRKSSFYRVIRDLIGCCINGCLAVVQWWVTGGLWIFTLHFIEDWWLGTVHS